LAILLACVPALSGCATGAPTGQATPTFFDPIPAVGKATPPPWFLEPMVDVNTGKSFQISQFAGKVVLMDTMATWCPTCQGEMSQVQLVPGLLGAAQSEVVLVSLDVDPNEDATILKKFAAKNKFDWYIAIATTSVGQFLAKNYDVNYLNPPLQPMLIIDKAGGVYGLPTGIKSAISIQKTLAQFLGQ
jgi:cytochrome oxidase Cu insertion factor (SCO1/SenC/PrrC family)